MKVLMIILFLLISFSVNAEDDQLTLEQKQMQKQIEEIMKHRDELFKSLLNDDSFNDMEKRMHEMMKQFGGEDFDFNDDSFFGGNVVGEYNWKEDNHYKILALKVTQIKDHPLDIKIEKGQIKIKGDVESTSKNKKKKSKVHFERVFSIPSGVDEKNPEFENANNELLIKFKKLNQTNNKKINSIKNIKQNEDRVPVSPNEKDLSL